MNRSLLVRMALAALLGASALALQAQQALEIIPLRHRTVEQVLPALQPLLEPGAALSGSRGQLFLRASPANAAEIKRALETIDRPSRRLQISVRFDEAQERDRRDIGASGTVGRRGSRVDITAEDRRTSAAERVDQRLQVLEGSRAWIQAGESRPIPVPGGGVVLQDRVSGFEVIPRFAGGQVELELLSQRPTAQAATTITARLGEWVEVGAVAQSTARDDRGIASSASRRGSETRRVWLKVEALD